MNWGFLTPIAAWLVGVALFWLLGNSLVGASAAGQRAVPIVAVLWPLAAFFLLAVAIWAGFETLVARGIESVFGPRDEDAP